MRQGPNILDETSNWYSPPLATVICVHMIITINMNMCINSIWTSKSQTLASEPYICWHRIYMVRPPVPPVPAGRPPVPPARPAGRTVLSSTLRTWNMVPHPRGEMLSSMNSSNKPRSRKWEKTQKPRIRLVFYHDFFTILPKVEYDPMVDTHILV